MRWSAARLIGSWSLAHFGYRASLIAMPLLALQQTGSAWTVGLVSGAAGVPAITAPWWTGRLQRRLCSANALAALMVGEGFATLLVPTAASFNALTPLVMIVAGLIVGVLNAVSGPLNASLVAAVGDTIEARRHVRATGAERRSGAARLLALQETAVKVATTIAPVVALALIAVIGATWTVATEGLLTLAAATLIAMLPVSSHLSGDTGHPRVRTLLRRHRELALGWTVRGLGCAGWFSFTLGLTLLGEARGSGVLLATVGLGSYSAGAVVGSSLGVLTASSTRPALVNSLSWLVAGVGWLTMGVLPNVVLICVVAAVMGLAVPAGNAATMAMVTRSFTGLERRAALTSQATVVTGSSTMGMLLGGPLIAVVGPQVAIMLAGSVVTTAAAAVALSEYSRARTDSRSQRGWTTQRVTYDRELPRLQRR